MFWPRSSLFECVSSFSSTCKFIFREVHFMPPPPPARTPCPLLLTSVNAGVRIRCLGSQPEPRRESIGSSGRSSAPFSINYKEPACQDPVADQAASVNVLLLKYRYFVSCQLQSSYRRAWATSSVLPRTLNCCCYCFSTTAAYE
jgi:hypothetical protein